MRVFLDLAGPFIWTADDVLSPSECRSLVARIEAGGPAPAPITTGKGFVMRPDIRNNTRVILDDAPLAAALYDRVLPHLPPVLSGWNVCGANERFRGYRYEAGQRFALHYDGAFERSVSEVSRLTFLVYLNDDYAGGTTDFPDHQRRIEPRAGRALFFQHRILHEGCPVTAGVKYVLRSDIMYRAPGAAPFATVEG
jgi:prolyl 4-hydroxylase